MANGVFGVVAPHPPIIVPAVGGAQANGASGTIDALTAIGDAIGRYQPETLVVMSPHAPAVRDRFLVDASERYEGSLAMFGDSRNRSWPGDSALAKAILGEAAGNALPVFDRCDDPRLEPGVLDHGCLVPLHFLDPQGSYRLVVVSLSGRPYEEHRTFGQSVRRAADKLGRRVVFVASGDMSHRLTPDAAAGYSPDARRLDAAIVGLVEQGRLAGLMSLEPELVDAGGECGLRSVITLGGFCCEDPAPASVLSYEGPWGVGYLTAVIGRSGLDALASAPASASGAKGGLPGHDDSPIVELARAAVALWVTHGEVLEPRGLDGAGYPARAGVFVSLHEHGDLRGCIGTIAPTKTTLAEEVVANAIEASSYDPRFEPVGADELDQLEIKVDVLHAPESCRIEDLDPSRYGVIVTRGGRRGLLLPDLEGVDDVETQVAIACKKAGIADGATCDFERFKVDRYT